MKNKDQIQSEALNKLIENDGGLIVATMGSGKSKCAIDFLKSKKDITTVLITSPRENLKKNWKEELEKWSLKKNITGLWNIENSNIGIQIDIENIQTCYKWNNQQYDLIILDEIHTIATPEYGKLLENNKFKYVVGLTGTPEFDKPEKKEFYDKYCPLVYEYYDSANDGLINQTRVLVYNHNLTNDYQVLSGNKNNRFYQGELDKYNYLTDQVKKGQQLMAGTGSEDWWNDAVRWFYKNQGNPTKEEKNAARIYLNSIKFRKDFLHNLKSTSIIARRISDKILENENNKVLIFSELTKQIDKITHYSYHSKNHDDVNNQMLRDFNDGKIRELGSSKSLTLGLNLKGANYALFESYVGSATSGGQKQGRLNRLDKDDIATLIIIKVNQSQAEKWYKRMIEGLNTNNIQEFDNLNKLLEEIK